MDLTTAIEARRNPDGGYGPTAGAASEPEATALAALAIGDTGAAAWLEERQRPDGSVGIVAGPVFRDVTAPAVLAMRSPAAIAAGATYLAASPARSEPSTEQLPHDASARGWAWTSDTFGWVEPTSWSVLALRVLGQDGSAVEDGLAVLRDRECVGGGWNYGNRVVLGESLPPFVQTTAIAVLALAGRTDEAVLDRGVDRLASSWRAERDGALSLALAAAALRMTGRAEADDALATVRTRSASAEDVDTVALAWAALALGDGLSRLEVT